MTEQKPKRGGRRNPPGGRPATGVKRKAIQVSFTDDDLAVIEALFLAKYGLDRTQIIRRAIREALERIRTKP
jgi:hypothetical protein